METLDYFSGRCPFLINQNQLTGAIVLTLTNGHSSVTTALMLSQINELEIPIHEIKNFDRNKFGDFYQLLTML